MREKESVNAKGYNRFAERGDARCLLLQVEGDVHYCDGVGSIQYSWLNSQMQNQTIKPKKTSDAISRGFNLFPKSMLKFPGSFGKYNNGILSPTCCFFHETAVPVNLAPSMVA